jgi:endonuclease YncB( thermonuclease family)
LAPVLALVAGAALLGPPATAVVPSTPSSWLNHHSSARGVVRHVVDGDTESVDAWGDGIVTTESVRNAGIQAMETGQCHSAEASAAMARLTLGKVVRMTSRDPASASYGRPLRFVDVDTAGGSVDTQLSLLRAGHALPLVIPPESGRWRTYFAAAQQAAAAGRNLWDADYCGAGPDQGARIRIWASYDADGADLDNVNGEYARILNRGTRPLSLAGWWVRSAALNAYVFPRGTVVQPGATLTLRVGTGRNTATTRYWGQPSAIFRNVDTAEGFGNGVYLFDPDGDLRAHAIYPCLQACSDPLLGKVTMSVNDNAPGSDPSNPNGEYVVLSPRTGAAVDLSYRVLTVWGSTYELPRGSVVRPGERLVVRIGKGRSTRLNQYWGKSTAVLTNTGAVMVLRSTEDLRIACTAWGTGRC